MKKPIPSIRKNANGEILALLQSDFAKKHDKNPRFSMNSYARAIGISRSTLSKVFSGKLLLSKRTGLLVAARIKKDDSHLASQITELLTEGRRQKMEYSALDQKKLHVLSDWHYFAIRSLVETDDFLPDADWIAGRLGISNKKASQGLQMLIDLDVLKKDETGHIEPTGKSLQTTNKLINLTIRKFNSDFLRLADECLNEMNEKSFKKTSFTNMLMSIDPDLIPEANRRIINFHKRLCEFLENGSQKKEVYNASIALFPVTKESVK